MDVTQQTNNDQTTLWNGVAAQAWVDAQELTDQVFRPLNGILVDASVASAGGRLLDVGCGTGSTTLAAARLLGAKGQCVGIDVSQPMIAAAQARAELDGVAARFLRADAQTYAFEPGSFDTVISRFGVMFFDDPVRAFANLLGAVRRGGDLRFIAWRSAAENPFMTTAERAAATVLPNMPARQPDGPGQFAFADRDRVHGILDESGWAEIDIRPIDVSCGFAATGLMAYATRFGPLGRMLPELDEPTRTRVIGAVRPAFDAYVHGDEVRFDAACWMVRARRAG
jgi:SAM-dependent methyltransferase